MACLVLLLYGPAPLIQCGFHFSVRVVVFTEIRKAIQCVGRRHRYSSLTDRSILRSSQNQDSVPSCSLVFFL